MTQQKLQLQFDYSVPRYGLAAAWVAIALAIAFFLEHHEFHRGALPVFLLAVALSAWYGGGRFLGSHQRITAGKRKEVSIPRNEHEASITDSVDRR